MINKYIKIHILYLLTLILLLPSIAFATNDCTKSILSKNNDVLKKINSVDVHAVLDRETYLRMDYVNSFVLKGTPYYVTLSRGRVGMPNQLFYKTVFKNYNIYKQETYDNIHYMTSRCLIRNKNSR